MKEQATAGNAVHMLEMLVSSAERLRHAMGGIPSTANCTDLLTKWDGRHPAFFYFSRNIDLVRDFLKETQAVADSQNGSSVQPAKWEPGSDPTYCKNCGRTFDMHAVGSPICPVQKTEPADDLHARGMRDYMLGGAGW